MLTLMSRVAVKKSRHTDFDEKKKKQRGSLNCSHIMGS